MINKHTTIKIGNTTYKLSFNFGVIKQMQNRIQGLKVEDIFKGVENQDYNIITDLLYLGIKFNHPNFDIKEVDSLGVDDIEEVFNAIARVFNIALPTTEVDEEEKN